MANLAAALKEEILRLARKESRSETEGLKKASTQFRAEVSSLKKRVAELEKLVARLGREAAGGRKAKAEPEAEPRVRFSAKSLATLRRRLGLSAAELGALLGVSAQTIYNWEADKSKPRAAQLTAFASLKGIGKKQAAARLAATAAE